MVKTRSSPEPTQQEKFEAKARELECDDDEAAFAERVKRMAMAPRGEHPAKPK